MSGEFELFFRIEGSQYGDGVMLDKYGDRYSLVAAGESQKGGTVYKRWAFPQDKDKQPRPKAIPMGVSLGNRTQAIGILRSILNALDKPANDPISNDDDITF